MAAVGFEWRDTTAAGLYGEIRSPSIELDTETGVLFVHLQQNDGAVISELDDEEIFVFTDQKTGMATGFTIPHFVSYWSDHRLELVEHLATYAPDFKHDMVSLIFGAESSTASEVYERQYA